MKGPRGECPLLLPATVQGQAGPRDRTALATGKDVRKGSGVFPRYRVGGTQGSEQAGTDPGGVDAQCLRAEERGRGETASFCFPSLHLYPADPADLTVELGGQH